MSDLADELRAIGRTINHDEYVDAGVVPLTLAQAANRIEALEAQLVSDIRAETEIERLECRIEALEAALRNIAAAHAEGGQCSELTMVEIARAALEPEK